MTFWEILSTPFLLLWTYITSLWMPLKEMMDNNPLFKTISIITSIMTGTAAIIAAIITWVKRRH